MNPKEPTNDRPTESSLPPSPRLVEAGNTVIVVEHDMHVAAASDWIMDMGSGAGDEGGRIAAEGRPRDVSKVRGSRTAAYLARCALTRKQLMKIEGRELSLSNSDKVYFSESGFTKGAVR